MPVQHKDICESGVNPIQCAYYNKDHKIVNMLGYELVEEKNLPSGTTTFTFNNLDGDTDEEYLIEGIGTLVRTSGDSVMSMYPNNDLGSNYQGAQFYGTSSPSNSGSGITTLRLCSTFNSTNSTVFFKGNLLSKSGIQRMYMSRAFTYNSAGRLSISNGCAWTNITDNIISLVFLISNGSFGGTIRLWKRIPLDGGE